MTQLSAQVEQYNSYINYLEIAREKFDRQGRSK